MLLFDKAIINRAIKITRGMCKQYDVRDYYMQVPITFMHIVDWLGWCDRSMRGMDDNKQSLFDVPLIEDPRIRRYSAITYNYLNERMTHNRVILRLFVFFDAPYGLYLQCVDNEDDAILVVNGVRINAWIKKAKIIKDGDLEREAIKGISNGSVVRYAILDAELFVKSFGCINRENIT